MTDELGMLLTRTARPNMRPISSIVYSSILPPAHRVPAAALPKRISPRRWSQGRQGRRTRGGGGYFQVTYNVRAGATLYTCRLVLSAAVTSSATMPGTQTSADARRRSRTHDEYVPVQVAPYPAGCAVPLPRSRAHRQGRHRCRACRGSVGVRYARCRGHEATWPRPRVRVSGGAAQDRHERGRLLGTYAPGAP